MLYGKNIKVDFETATNTIGLFERALVAPSRFHNCLNTDNDALNNEEKNGLDTFVAKGCATCHNNVALDETMQAFEITAQYKHNNLGDFKGDKNTLVKAPALRNITQTAPYYHNVVFGI